MSIPALLRENGLRPKKGLGQNFLVDEGMLQRIVRTAGLAPGDAVLEIGPGLGSLTRHLALSAGWVVAVELDQALVPVLQKVLAPYSNVRIVQGDILDMEPAELMGGAGYVVVANIPYYITSAVIRHLLDRKDRPRRVVLTVQKEVAERICAQAGDLSLLALSVQVYGEPSIAGTIPAEAFHPAPKVDSAIVCMDIHPEPVIPWNHLDTFFSLAKAGFNQKRKTLRNSLSPLLGRDNAMTILLAAGIDPMRRAETLSLEEWKELATRAPNRAQRVV